MGRLPLSASASRLVRVDCPGCGSPENLPELTGTDAYSGHAFELVRCVGCELVYVNPRPEGQRLTSYYPADYYSMRHPVFKDLFVHLRVRKLGSASHDARLLDIGCGLGDFIVACKRRGWDAVGVEQANSPVIGIRDSLGVDIITPESIQTLPDSSFDAVTLWHVLEHLPQPRADLQQLYRLLKPGGRLLVEAPNFGSWLARFGGRHLWHHLDLPRHLIHFERRSLANLLLVSGFAVETWQTFSLEYDAFGLAQTLLDRVCSHPNHLFQLLRRKSSRGGRWDTAMSFTLLPLAGAISAIVSLVAPAAGQGGVLRVVARKGMPPSGRFARQNAND